MIDYLKSWFRRHFSDPQAVALAVVLIVGFFLVYWAGEMLAPVIAAMVIAYLLQGLVQQLTRLGVPRIISVITVFIIFVTALLVAILRLFPLLYRQVTQLEGRLGVLVEQTRAMLIELPGRFPELLTEAQVSKIIASLQNEIVTLFNQALTFSLSSVLGFITIIVYLILVPVLVFFFLKDFVQISAWVQNFLPRERKLVSQVWMEVNKQIGNYVRGKFIEILIVGSVTYIAFSILGMDFALLLSVLNGLSVIIPYIGAVAVTLPIAAIAYLQWGLSPDFYWLMSVYLVIQILDGNMLVPLIFSEVVNLHPIAIIVAILIFGGMWGFWGVFFAIPLATLVQAVLITWPSYEFIEYDDRLNETT